MKQVCPTLNNKNIHKMLTAVKSREMEILVQNRNFGQKSKFWSKIEILVKNRNFGQKSKFY